MPEETHQRQFRGTYAPPSLHRLVDSGEITPKEAWLLMTIDSFVKSSANGKGCFASNGYLGQRCQMAAYSVAHSIKKLEDMGLISRESWDGNTRYLWVNYPREGPPLPENGKGPPLPNGKPPPCRPRQDPLAAHGNIENTESSEYSSPPDKPAGGNGHPVEFGKKPPAEESSARFQKLFLRLWGKRYPGAKYQWLPRDGPLLKKLHAALKGDRPAFKAILTRFFADDFRGFVGHSVTQLYNNINRWSAPPPALPGGPKENGPAIRLVNAGAAVPQDIREILEDE